MLYEVTGSRHDGNRHPLGRRRARHRPAGRIRRLLLGRHRPTRGQAAPQVGLGNHLRRLDPHRRHHLPPGRAGRRPNVVISTRELTKRYGATTALDGVNLEVPDGSIYGLAGPNGSGKTTFLGIIAGLRDATSGEVVLGVERSEIAVLSDTPQFDKWLTGREVVSLALELASPGAGTSRVDEVLEATGIAEAADRRVGGYSRGMLQRLGIAATLVSQASTAAARRAGVGPRPPGASRGARPHRAPARRGDRAVLQPHPRRRPGGVRHRRDPSARQAPLPGTAPPASGRFRGAAVRDPPARRHRARRRGAPPQALGGGGGRARRPAESWSRCEPLPRRRPAWPRFCRQRVPRSCRCGRKRSPLSAPSWS